MTDQTTLARGGAEISADGLYRYRLWRSIDLGLFPNRGMAAFVMCNPSTADARLDDPTLRRCLGFARTWGYADLEIVNLYAYRSAEPADLFDVDDAAGPLNPEALNFAISRADLVVAAWGAVADRVIRRRADGPPDPRSVVRIMADRHRKRLTCIGPPTADGHPPHPARLDGKLTPIEYRP